MTLGSGWTQLLEGSLARKMTNILHLDTGNPQWKLTDEVASLLDTPPDKEDYERWIYRMHSDSIQASEIVWRYENLLKLSDILLIECRMVDTALGQFLIQSAGTKPVWAIGTDARLSPIAPVWIKGVMYPRTPDDLVKLVLTEVP